MKFNRANFAIIVCAVIAVVLQIVFAPVMTFFGVMPNFITSYVIAVAVVRLSSKRVIALSFILGICYNLFIGGPLGAMAAALTFVAYFAGRAMYVLNNDTMFMPLFVVAVAVFVCEILYAILISICGFQASFFDVVVYRVLPCSIYNIILSFVWVFVMRRVASEPSSTLPPIDESMILR